MTDLEARADDLLTYLELSEPARRQRCDRGPEFFGSPIVFMGEDVLSAADFRVFTHVPPSSITGPIDISMIVGLHDDLSRPDLTDEERARAEAGTSHDMFALSRVRRIDPGNKSVRRYLTHRRHWTVESQVTLVDTAQGTYSGAYDFLGWDGSDWEQLTAPRRHFTAYDIEEVKRRVRGAMGLLFTRRYYWTVSLQVHRHGISFLTDPEGAREAFRLRDAPPGRSRRAALRHWVKDHYRRRRGPGDPAFVRSHLRGATEFVWHGMKCTLTPSPYDLERLSTVPAMCPTNHATRT